MDGPVSTSTIQSYLLLTKILYVVDNWENDNFKNRQIAFLVVKNEPTFEHFIGAVQHCFLNSIPPHLNFLCWKKIKQHSFYDIDRDLKKPTDSNEKKPHQNKSLQTAAILVLGNIFVTILFPWKKNFSRFQ